MKIHNIQIERCTSRSSKTLHTLETFLEKQVTNKHNTVLTQCECVLFITNNANVKVIEWIFSETGSG